MNLQELTTISQMLAQFQLMQHLYPALTLEKYEDYLTQMILHNYSQIAVFENKVCVALTGFWVGVKLWSGKYIEIDNFIVHPDFQQKGYGKFLTDYLDQKAITLDCNLIVLDAFTQNFKAHRFYYNQGFAPKGFHFVKTINADGLT